METPRPRPRVWAIVVGAGSGARFGGAKQFAPLGDERVLDRSLRLAAQACEGVIAVVPSAAVDQERARLTGATGGVATDVVPGGSSRTASVACGLARVPDDADVICVHDAARPLATVELFERVVAAVQAGADAAVPALPLADTVKQVAPDGSVVTTPDRSTLVTVQTPQAFSAAALRAAHGDPTLAADPSITDDAMMVERRGGRVVVVPGDPANRKITHADDLRWAQEACR